MKAMLKTLLLAADRRLSKTKVVALVAAALNLAQTFGWIDLTPEELAAANTALVALFGIFLRDGVTNP